MILFGKRKLEKAVAYCNLVINELKETVEAIYEAVGSARDLDDKDALAHSLDSVKDYVDKVDSAKRILTEILGRHRKAVSTHAEKTSAREERSPFSFSFSERTIRRAVEQSGRPLESMEKLHDLVSRAVRSAICRDDQEKLDQALITIAVVRDKLSQVHNTLTDINQRLEQIELEALYAPPSYFGGE